MTEQYGKNYLNKKFLEAQNFLKLFYYAGPATFLVFSVVDAYRYPDFKVEFFLVRLFFCFSVFVGYHFCKNAKSIRTIHNWSLIWSLVGSLCINYMMFRSDGPGSAYYAGINLVAIFSLVFFSVYNLTHFAIFLTAIYTPYYLLCYLQFDRFTSLRDFFINSAFNAGTICGIFLATIRKEKDFKSIVNAELLLETELTNREQIIIQKTDEATKLHQLSSQFSPQVVKAIKNGHLKIEESGQVSTICAIFIDIVKSTDKVTKLDHKDIQLSLERFLDTCLTTFLKYDLTIDKFHGDGILAFSNMPIPRQDFIERSCDAALEALDMIKKDQSFYVEHWKDELQVRVGISVGSATVGFYGNKKYFKTFTAIGTPLPYASRLTSAALPNQILVDDQINSRLSNLGYVTKNQGQKKLKGFEDDSKFVYELISSPNAVLTGDTAKTCPTHANSVLYLDTNKQGLFVFKCRDCDYEEDQLSENTNPRIKVA